MTSKQEATSLYEIKITLMDLIPAIWRRVTVPRDITLGKLHDVIQIAMGWEDDHLHEFFIGRKRYGPLMSDSFAFGDPPVNEDIVYLNGVLKPKAKFVYQRFRRQLAARDTHRTRGRTGFDPAPGQMHRG